MSRKSAVVMRTMVLLISAAALLLLATSCGGNSGVPQDEGPVEVIGENRAIYNDAGWTTERDPLTGREFRCWTALSSFDIRGVGLASFCYELEE